MDPFLVHPRDPQRILAVLGLHNVVARDLQKLLCDITKRSRILHKENRFRSLRRSSAALSASAAVDGPIHSGQVELKRRALSRFAVHPNVSTALLDGSVYGRKTQPCPIRLGRKEWLEDVRRYVCIHAHSWVAHRYHHVTTGQHR